MADLSIKKHTNRLRADVIKNMILDMEEDILFMKQQIDDVFREYKNSELREAVKRMEMAVRRLIYNWYVPPWSPLKCSILSPFSLSLPD